MSRAAMVDPSPLATEEQAEDTLENEDEAEEIQQIADEVEQPQEEEPAALPEKYLNKSLGEVVQMHQEAEKLLGRQSTEVGELRQVVDDYISSQPQQSAPQHTVEPEDDLDYFTDPQAAVNRAIENHPKIREAEEYSNQYKKQSSLAELKSKHPDMQDVLQDEKFVNWIKSSKIRTQLFAEADQNFNAEAADELFTLWKERRTVAQQTASVEKQARKQQLKAANTGNAQGSGEQTRRKIYRRADIIKLIKTDPERYQALSEEILKAYAEGRVK